MNRETGIVMFRFHRGISAEQVQQFWIDFYDKNRDKIEGMITNQFIDEETYADFKREYSEWEKRDNKAWGRK